MPRVPAAAGGYPAAKAEVPKSAPPAAPLAAGRPVVEERRAESLPADDELETVALTVGRALEESLEYTLTVTCAATEKCKSTLELVLDRSSPDVENPKPAKNAMVKSVEADLNATTLIQNMPSGRNFLIRGVVEHSLRPVQRTAWVRARTLAITEPTPENSQDINGDFHGKCMACPCKGFRWDRTSICLNSDIPVSCRGCGDPAQAHECLSSLPQLPREKPEPPQLWIPPGKVKLPPEAPTWNSREQDLYRQSSGRFHPQQALSLRRAELPGPTTKEDLLTHRVSCVSPTTDARHEFHAQLWAVFDAQKWVDKELVVIETYKDKPSEFFQEKAKVDSRIVYLSYQVDPDHDWSIGLKRNICTHMASGAIIVNFDDDDLYAPSYLDTVVGAMVDQQCEALTLSTWHVYDVKCSKFGWVDCRAASDSWKYGYGFSYAFLRHVALGIPYPDCNLGEDYGFYDKLRKLPGQSLLGGYRHVGLLQDEFGICCHTLHPKATSGVKARREVPFAEVAGLDVADTGLLEEYMSRFEKTSDFSRYISKDMRRLTREVKISSSFGDVVVTCPPGATVDEVKGLFASQICKDYPPTVETVELHRSGKDREDETQTRWWASGPAMGSGERVSVRTTELWATLPLDRGDPPEVRVSFCDVRDPNVFIDVSVHRFCRLQQVLAALKAQLAPVDTPEGRAKTRGVRLADQAKGNDRYFAACSLTDWLGDRRHFFAPGLADVLGDRCDELDLAEFQNRAAAFKARDPNRRK